MATMKDIAKLAGVSSSTVSHVINQSRYVSEEITQKVKQAAQRLNYTPSELGRSLKTNRTRTFGMLMTTSSNPFFGEVVKGVERSCYQQHYNLIVCNTEGDSVRMKASIDTLLQKRVDGLILMCPDLKDYQFNISEQYLDIPIVIMDWGEVQFTCDKIQDNSLRGGYLATQHLIDMGHQQIGCITGPLDNHQAQMRYQGYQQAMSHADLEPNVDWIIEGNFECKSGYDALKRIFKPQSATQSAHNSVSNRHHSIYPSAIFVSNDMMAMGAIQAASELGIRIPEDLSLIGYDDIEIAKFMTPALTTIHQPKHRLGQRAVEALIKRLSDLNRQPQLITLEPTLIERKSVLALSVLA